MSLASLPQARAVRDVPVATAAQMAELDRVAAEELGVPLATLMETACRQIARCVDMLLDGARGKTIVATVGSGNNGGDALGAVRYLRDRGAIVEAVVAAPRERLRPLAAEQYDALVSLGARVRHATTVTDVDLIDTYKRVDLIIDGLLGYSSTGAPRGEVARLIKITNAARDNGLPRVLAVDLPSGLGPDDGVPQSQVPDETIHAITTITLGAPKPGLIRAEARPYVGDLVLADIGIPVAAYARIGIDATRLFADGDLLCVIS